MSKFQSRIKRLEENQPPCVCMVAVKYLDGTIDWNNAVFPDEAAFDAAFAKSGLKGPLIIMNDYGGRDAC